MATTSFTIYKENTATGKPYKSYLDFEVTYPDLIKESASSAITGQVTAMVSILWKAVRDTEGYYSYDSYPTLIAKIFDGDELAATNTLEYMFAKDNGEFDPPTPYTPPSTLVNQFGMIWPVYGDGSDKNLTIKIYDADTGRIAKEISVPTTTVNVTPKIVLPEGESLVDYIQPGGTVPEGWPLMANLPGAKAVLKFDVENFVEYPGTVKFGSGFAMLMPAHVSTAASQAEFQHIEGDEENWYTAILDMPDYRITDAESSSVFDTKLDVSIVGTNGVSGQATADISDGLIQEYKKPKVYNYTVDRCDSNGVVDDEGTYAKVRYSLELYQPDVENLSNPNRIQSTAVKVGNTIISSELLEPDIDHIIGGSFSSTIEYDITLSVVDIAGGEALVSGEIESAYCTMDFLKGGKGIAFGKVADKEGFENDMESFFNKPVHIINGDLSIEKTLKKQMLPTVPDPTYLTENVPVIFVDEEGNVHIRQVVQASEPTLNTDGEYIYGNTIREVFRLESRNKKGSCQITVNSPRGYSWFDSRDGASLYGEYVENNGAIFPLLGSKTPDGAWTCGPIRNTFCFGYVTDANYNANTNKTECAVSFDPAQTSKLKQVVISSSYLLDLIYPIGAVYLSYVSTSPASLFGGTWTQMTGRYIRMANDVTAGGSDGHTHGLNTGAACLSMDTSSSGRQMYKYFNTSQWTSNYGATNAGSMGSRSANHSTGMSLYGNSASTNHYPPYQDLYAWRRTG